MLVMAVKMPNLKKKKTKEVRSTRYSETMCRRKPSKNRGVSNDTHTLM